jgi:cation transport regulator ChaC
VGSGARVKFIPGRGKRARRYVWRTKAMTEREIWTFFYGSYIDLDVLKEVDYTPREHKVARLPGFDITIRPLANLVRSDRQTVYGIAATGTHAELARLYDHAENILGGRYLPEAVLVQTTSGLWMPVLTYIAPKLSGEHAEADYVDRIAKPAKAYGFPSWYIERIESFRS